MSFFQNTLSFTAGILMIFWYSPVVSQSPKKFTLSGYIRESGSKESLIGVSISVPIYNTGTSSNTYGFYSITLPATDSLEIQLSSAGYATLTQKISLSQDLELNFDLAVQEEILNEVVVTAQDRTSDNVQMSTIDVPIAQIKNIPALLGEKDVLKVLQLMPGVQKGSEGNSGLYVRGGGPDQNLLILDDAIVYNAYHLFGFFSVFNGDALKSVELTKGGFPARYGGRLSSVIEMNMKDGNKEKFHGEGGIGLISSRLTLEGPIVKGKSSFLISGRRTYIDALVYPFLPQNQKGGYNFYDLNAKLNYDFGRKNKVYLSGYFGRDKAWARNSEDNSKFAFGLGWGNATATARWNHLFNQKLFSNTSFIFSNYSYKITQNDEYEGNKFDLKYSSGIRDLSLKYALDYTPSPQHNFKLGIHTIYHRFTPSAIVIKSSDQFVQESQVQHIDNLESGVYVEDIYRPFPRMTINGGVRLSMFNTEKKYYVNPEPRIAAAYKLGPDLAVKGSYAIMNQYLHLLSNTGIGLPTDLWVPATQRISPQRSSQVAAGFAKDFVKQNLNLTVEGYYKTSTNVTTLKEGASFLLADGNPKSWENNMTSGNAWSYGLEFLLQRKIGRFSGWAGYTLSWTQLQFDSINNGATYFARYDRRHDISLVGIYKPKERITLSATWVYGTGNAISLPLDEFVAPRNEPTPGRQGSNEYYFYSNNYGPKNSFRAAPYHRLDIGIQFHKKLKWGGERTWELSVYNVYNRKNPFFYYIDSENAGIFGPSGSSTKRVLKQISLFPFIPSISYNLKF